MKKKTKKKKSKTEIHTFKTFKGAESYFREIFGLKVKNDKNVINSVCSDFIEDFLISDVADIYDNRIYLNTKKIQSVKSDIADIDSEILKLKKKILKLDESKAELSDYLFKLEKDNSAYISYKKKYEENSIKSIIDRVLLIYIKDSAEFNDITLQEVFNDYENMYNQNFIIKYLDNFLDSNMNKTVTVIDNGSDDETEYSLELDFSTVRDLKKVIDSLIINLT